MLSLCTSWPQVSSEVKSELSSAAKEIGGEESARTAAIVMDPWKQEDIVAALKNKELKGNQTFM